MKLKHLDLFSGIGGFALAAQRAGFETVGLSEIDEHACRVLARHWPNVRNYGNIRNADFSGLRDAVAVVSGGFPCQPFSYAGERRGANDDRHLWPAMLGAIDTIRPAWVLGENVPGLITLGLDQVLADLESRGYASQSFVVPACAVGGGHRRDRIWICAHAQREGWKRHLAHDGLSGGEGEAHAELGDRIAGSWDEMAGRARNLRSGDGLSVQVVRNEVKGYGNAIVPEIAEVFFRLIVQIEASAFAEAH